MKIRDECLLSAAEGWIRPTGIEIRSMLADIGRQYGLLDKGGNPRPLSGSETAKLLGLGPTGGRTVRRWTSEASDIPFAAWSILCSAAGYGQIWKVEAVLNIQDDEED